MDEPERTAPPSDFKSAFGDDWTNVFLLQVLAMGMILGNPELRKRVDADDFSDSEFRSACRELQSNPTPKKSKLLWGLPRVLALCGIELDGKSKPADIIFARLALDANCSRALAYLNGAAEIITGNRAGNDLAKAEFLRRIIHAQDELKIDEGKLPKAEEET